MPPKAKCTWILLRGLAREKRHWGPFLEQFEAAFPDEQVLALDLPGSGEYFKQTGPRSVEGIFNFVRGQAISQSATPKFKILSLSLGAMVAMEWLRQRPDELAEVILINPSTSLSPFYERLRWQVWRDFFKVLTIQSARDREKAVLEILVNSPEIREAALPLWTKIGIESPISYINFFNQIFAASRFKALENATKSPTLILNALGDRLVDPSCSTILHEKLQLPIARHSWGGHDLPWDDPKWVIEKVVAFDSSLKQ